MSETAKTVLIVGATAVGAFVLLRALSPPVVRSSTTSNGSAISGIGQAIGGLATLGASLFGGGGSAGKPTSGAPSVGYEPGESFDDFYTGMFGPGSTDVAGG